ncbi:MAG: hypothetical protein HY559_00750, partial [Gammaproteobacteria bacterium]|nr:hypothetical protein [Gammaproteobacteria bacterium]
MAVQAQIIRCVVRGEDRKQCTAQDVAFETQETTEIELKAGEQLAFAELARKATDIRTEGNDLILKLIGGGEIRIVHFFALAPSEEVLQGQAVIPDLSSNLPSIQFSDLASALTPQTILQYGLSISEGEGSGFSSGTVGQQIRDAFQVQPIGEVGKAASGVVQAPSLTGGGELGVGIELPSLSSEAATPIVLEAEILEPSAERVLPVTTTVTAVNASPTVSGIVNQAIDEDGNTGALTFTIGDAETAGDSLTVEGSSSNPTLVPNANIVFGGSGANRTVTATPVSNQSGTATITVTVTDATGGSSTGTFDVTVTAVNDPPTVSEVANQIINEDGGTGTLAFTADDLETAADNLTLSSTSSNTTLIPTTNIVLGGSGANRTVTVTPVANQTGTATITLTVNDGTTTTSDTFVLTVNAVNDAPINSVPGNQSVNEDTILEFKTANSNAITISDIDAGSSDVKVTLSVNSGTLTITNTAGLTFTAGDGTSDTTMTFTGSMNTINTRLDGATLQYQGNANFSGTDTLTITTDDQGNTGSGGAKTDIDTVAITVNAVNDAPTISDIANQSTNEDTATGAIAFTVGDQETTAGSLTVSGSSSNTDLVPYAYIAFGGSGANRTVTLT